MPRVLLLTGTCGSGKSTIAKLIARRRGWTHFSEDDIWREHYHRSRGEAGSGEHRSKRVAVRRVMFALIGTAVATGYNVVVDATIHEASPDSLGEYETYFESAKMIWDVRVLHPRLETAIQRDVERSGWKAGSSGVESLWRKFSGAVIPPGSFLDTSDEPAAATARRVLESLSLD